MKLYVGNLSFNTSESQLRELFEPFGTVTSASLVMDRDTGRPRGFGFVEMGDATMGQAAIAGPKPREAGAGRGGSGGGRGGYGGGGGGGGGGGKRGGW
jgi:RNA recognition motif-containing protein